MLMKQTCPNCRYYKPRFYESLLGLSPYAMSVPWIKNLGFVNMVEMNMYLTGIFMYKMYNQDFHRVFDHFFTNDYEIRDHDTRSSNHFVSLMSAKSKLSASGIKYHIGVIIWNKILNTELNPDGSESRMSTCIFEAIYPGILCSICQTILIEYSKGINHRRNVVR